MNFQFYLEKLFASPDFRKFKQENPEAYPCSCFFAIDIEEIENPDNKQHFDYYVPGIRKMFSFQIESGCARIPIEMIGDESPKEISNNYDFELKDIEQMIGNKMQEQNITNKIQKILISLQKFEGKDFIVATVFISGLGMLKVKIDMD